MEEAKSLTMSDQPEKKQQKRFQCGSIKNLRVTSKDFPVGIAIRKAKQLALGMGISQSNAKKASEYAALEEESKCLSSEASGEGKNQFKGHHQKMRNKIWILRQLR